MFCNGDVDDDGGLAAICLQPRGDPSLSDEALDAAAERIAAAGVRHVGRLLVDSSWCDETPRSTHSSTENHNNCFFFFSDANNLSPVSRLRPTITNGAQVRHGRHG